MSILKHTNQPLIYLGKPLLYQQSVAPTPSYPTDGLLARYTFDDDLTDDYDSMSDLVQGAAGTATWSYNSDTPGSIGKSIKVGSNDEGPGYVKNEDDASIYNALTGTSSFSISMWGKIDNTSQDLAFLWSFYSGGTNRLALGFGGPSYKPSGAVDGCFYISLGNVIIDNVDYRASDAWRHYVYTYDGTTQKVYVNNVEKYSTARGSLSSTDHFNYGSVNGSWMIGSNSNGYIDLFYHYNKALTTTEITTLYNSGSGV